MKKYIWSSILKFFGYTSHAEMQIINERQYSQLVNSANARFKKDLAHIEIMERSMQEKFCPINNDKCSCSKCVHFIEGKAFPPNIKKDWTVFPDNYTGKIVYIDDNALRPRINPGCKLWSYSKS